MTEGVTVVEVGHRKSDTRPGVNVWKIHQGRCSCIPEQPVRELPQGPCVYIERVVRQDLGPSPTEGPLLATVETSRPRPLPGHSPTTSSVSPTTSNPVNQYSVRKISSLYCAWSSVLDPNST